MSVAPLRSTGAPTTLPGRLEPGSWCTLRGQAMGTTWTIKLSLGGCKLSAATLSVAIQAVLERISRQMSNWDEDSTLSALNRADTGWYQVPDELFHVLARALDVAEQTNGAYDPTLGRLNNLWGFGPAGAISSPPAAHEIDAALARSGWRQVAVDNTHQAIWQPGGVCFDLSSIGKGYGVDAVSSLLNEHHIEHYLVEIGGELKGKGFNSLGAAWSLAVEIPESHVRANTGSSMEQGSDAHATGESLPVQLKDCAIATSGDYRRYFEHKGRRYAHTLDPATGWPVDHGLVSVSVLHPDCMMADALSTALFSMGPERGHQYARSACIPALFMSHQGDDIQLRWSAAFQMPTDGGRSR